MTRKLCYMLVLFAVSTFAQTLPPPTAPSGTFSAPEGYYSWNYGLYNHSAYFTMETGLTLAGTHSFTVTLPSTINIHSATGTLDFNPWCAGQGFSYSVDVNSPAALGSSNVEHLFGDKFLVPGSSGGHQSNYKVDFGALSIPVTQVTFTYVQTGSCISLTSSWTVNMVTN